MMFLSRIIILCFALLPTATYSLTLKNPKSRGLFSQKEEGEARIKFNWKMKSKGDYFLEFSLDDKFQRVLVSKKIASLPYIWKTDITGHVWWRVSLFDKNKKLLERSKIRRFTIAPPAPSVDLSEIGGYFFEWDTIQKPEYFRFKVSKKRNFEPSLIKKDLKKKSYSLSKLEPGTYYWKVAAKYNRQIPLVYSKVRTLVVKKGITEKVLSVVERPKFKKVNLSTPKSPKSSRPIYKTLNETTSVKLSWGAVAKSSSYQLEVGERTDVISLKNYTFLKLGLGKYSWRVRAVSPGGGFGPWSERSNFEIRISKEKIDLESPKNKEINKDFEVEFEWKKNSQCSKYELIVSEFDDFSESVFSKKTEENSLSWDVEDEGQYFWYVKCLVNNKNILGSEVRELNVYE